MAEIIVPLSRGRRLHNLATHNSRSQARSSRFPFAPVLHSFPFNFTLSTLTHTGTPWHVSRLSRKRETEERGRRETVRELTEIKNTRCNVASTNMNEQERTHEATLSKSACAWAWLKRGRRKGVGGPPPQGRWGVIMQKGKAHKFAIFLELLSNANDV